MDERLREDTLHAIALVTAANSEPGYEKPLAAQLANDYVNEYPDDGHNRLVNGLIQLCNVLVALHRHDTDKSSEQVLLDAAELLNNWHDDE